MVQHSASLPNMWALQECATPPFIYLVPGAYEHRECYGLLLGIYVFVVEVHDKFYLVFPSALAMVVSWKQSIVGVGIACEHG